MSDHLQRMNKNIMGSPYYSQFSQRKQGEAQMPAMHSVMSSAPAGPKGYARSQAAAPVTQGFGRPVYANRGQAKVVGKYEKYNKKEYDAYARSKKRESDYFFVMNKGVCFLIFVFSLLLVGVLAIGIVGLPAADQYTSLYAEYDEAGAVTYITSKDPVFGFIDKVTGKDAATSEYHFISDAEAIGTAAEANPEDSMGTVANYLYQYYPVALAVLALFALITFLLSFFALFGKRIFKGFGAMGFVMLIAGAVALFAGLILACNKMGYPKPDDAGALVSVLNFSQLMPFLTRVFDSTNTVPYAANFGAWALVVLPLLILVFSIFARRKVPYSVFDR